MRLYNYRVKRKKRLRLFDPVQPGGYRKRRASRHHGYQRRRHKGLVKGLTVVACIFLCLILTGAGVFVYLRESGKKSLYAAAEAEAPDFGSDQDDAGLVSRKGKKYSYNEACINILCLGIDRSTDLTKTDQTELQTDETAGEAHVGESGQADTIVLLSLNMDEGTIKMLGISRDTMTEVSTYDVQGNYLGKSVNHLGLAYSYGDGGEKSGEIMTEAVSNLLYGLPIHGYAAVNLNAIEKINDSVGGVTVTLTDDIVLDQTSYKAGTTVTLDGSQAESFIRHRDMEQEGSNSQRMERQKQYALAFLDSARRKIKNNPTVVADLYQDLTSDMSTSIGLNEAVYLGSSLPGLSFSADDIAALQGTIKQGGIYEEFYPDEEALIDTVLDLFYSEVSS